eukprot:8523728-Ditylum_brightwellii.AAC.1
MGNSVNDDGQIIGNVAGLLENVAAAVGRLTKCNAEQKYPDKTERHDAFEGFILAIHAKLLEGSNSRAQLSFDP